MIYTKKDIEKEFNRLVKVQLDHGATINPWTMHGSQGEIAKVDFINSNHIERLKFTKKYQSILNMIGDEDAMFRIELLGFKNDPNVTIDSNIILWDHNGEVLVRFNYVKVDRNRFILMNDRMYQEAIRAKKARKSKGHISGITKLDFKYYPIFCKIISRLRIPGFIRVNPTMIRCITKYMVDDGSIRFRVNIKGVIFIFNGAGKYIRHF